MKLKFVLLALLAGSMVTAQKKTYLLVGTYTSKKGEGIYVYDFNTKTADNNLISIAKSSNPSYLAVSPNNKFVYAANENADSSSEGIGGSISAFAFDNGQLTFINKQFSGGKHPCYVAVDNSGKWVFAGNYSSGTLAVFPTTSTGTIDAATQIITHTGTGPNKDRQEGPHVHATVLSPDNNYLFVPNLGIDKVMSYNFNKITGKLTASTQVSANSEPGSGPRHIEFAPNKKYAYLAEEMSGTVVVYAYKNGQLIKQQRLNALPKDFKGSFGGADIHVSADNRFLYCSNRGSSNSITIFKINKTNGNLTVIGHQSTMGKTPRNFNFDPTGNFLLVANQESDNIVILKINKTTGLLTTTGKQISVPNPVCVKWIN